MTAINHVGTTTSVLVFDDLSDHFLGIILWDQRLQIRLRLIGSSYPEGGQADFHLAGQEGGFRSSPGSPQLHTRLSLGHALLGPVPTKTSLPLCDGSSDFSAVCKTCQLRPLMYYENTSPL